ncbi:MAG: PH domain-containing protein [Chloroflexi bacterium]|nr:PH domain-containing protein [Chloroflexota bacterium]
MAASKMVPQVICPNCRTANVHGSPYCSRCGAPLSNLPTTPAPAVAEAAPPDAQNDILRKFLSEEQDEILVRQIYLKASGIMTHGEEIEYIATANKSMVGSAPACVVATNKRLIDYKRKILGRVELDDCSWRDVREAQLREGRNGVTLIVETIQGWKLTADSLPHAQARRLFEVGAEHNGRLQAQLQQMVEATSSPAQSASPAGEAGVREVALPLQPEQEHFSMTDNAQREALDVAEQRAVPAVDAADGPLRLAPAEKEPEPAQQSWQTQPPSHTEPVSALPLSDASLSNKVGGLDDLLTPLLGKEAPGAKRAAGPLAKGPAPGAPVEDNKADEKAEEPLTYLSAVSPAPAHLVAYQVSTPHSLHNGASNGANNPNRPSDEGGLHLPGSNGLVAAALLHSEQDEGATKLPTAQMPPAQELNRAELTTDTSASHADPPKALAPRESPMRKLKQLKRMMEVGLITEADYEAKKTEILSRM